MKLTKILTLLTVAWCATVLLSVTAQDATPFAVPKPLLGPSFGKRLRITAKTVDASTDRVPKDLQDNGSVILEVIIVDGRKLKRPQFLGWMAAPTEDAPHPGFAKAEIELEGYEGGHFAGKPNWIPASAWPKPPPSWLGEFRWLPAFYAVRILTKAEQAGADQPATKPADKAPKQIQPSPPTPKDPPGN